MSYNNVVGGQLKLKGKALDVKAGGAKKKKAKKKESFEQKLLRLNADAGAADDDPQAEALRSPRRDDDAGEERPEGGHDEQTAVYEDHRTPAEKVYDDQRTRMEMKRLAKATSKSHRQKIEEFNQYLANLSEHYDIPKVGPG